MVGSGAASAASLEAGSPAHLGLSADRRGVALFAARWLAVTDVATRTVPADDDGSALFLTLERDGTVAANQSCVAVDGA